MARRLGPVTLALVILTLPSIATQGTPFAETTFALADDAALPAGFRLAPAPADPEFPTEVFVSNGAEPTMLVDKLGRALLIGDHRGVSRSTDGGVTWRRVSIPWIPGNVFGTGIFDGWALAQDDVGTIYATTTDGPIINVATSYDGGATWVQGISTYVVEASPLIADRPWLVARNNGQVAMTWNEGGQRQRCAYSTDSALTFTARTLPLLTNAFPIGGIPAFDAAGRLVFAGDGGIGGGAEALYRYDSSPCSTSVRRLQLPAVGEQLSTAVVTDATGAYYLGRPNADNSAMTLLALPGFTTAGSKSIVVSPPALKGNTFGTIAHRGNGEFAVTWYGTTTAGDWTQPGFNGAWYVYAARVTNVWSATPTITLTQVTTVPNHIGDLCMDGTNCDINGNGDRDLLDYFQTAYDAAGNLHIAYGHDGDTSNAEVRYAKLPALA